MTLEDGLERTIIVRFLRKYTNLVQLAQLFQDGAHLRPERELREYAHKRKVTLK